MAKSEVHAKREIYRAIAELAYAIGKVDGKLQDSEKKAFKEIIIEEFDLESWPAESRFDILDASVRPKVEHAFNGAISTIKQQQSNFGPDIKNACIRVLERVADAHKGTEEMEMFFIERFKKEVAEI